MSGPPKRGLRTILLLVVWLAATALIAFAVVRIDGAEPDDSGTSGNAAAVALTDRSTVSLAVQTIQPVISSDGVVTGDGSAFDLEAPVEPAAVAYGLLQPPATVRALILGGPAGFDCAWLGLAPGVDGRMAMRCRIPPDVTVIAGLTGTIVLGMTPAVDRMALPASAVIGAAERGEVVVVGADGSSAVRDVTIGASDTFWVEITGGLQPEEQVLTAPIEADFRGAS